MRWKRCAAVAGFIHFSITQGLFPRTARATLRTQLSIRTAIHGLTIFEKRLLDKKTAFCLLVCKKWSTFANRFNNKERHEHNKTHAGCQPPVGCPRFSICHRRGTRHFLFPASLRLGAWHNPNRHSRHHHAHHGSDAHHR